MSYILGDAPTAELRLEILNELTNKHFIDAIHPLPRKNVRILILGCGSGHLEAQLSPLFSESEFMGIDISAGRIKEAVQRTKALDDTNTYKYVQADLTKFSVKELKPFDILISKFVLSHISGGIQVFERFEALVKKGGFVCLNEGSSDSSEYFCNTGNVGYSEFIKMVSVQIEAQKSSFQTGFQLLTKLKKGPYQILTHHLSSAILWTEREKSILRLGLEEAKPVIMKHLQEEKLERILESLKEFEKDDDAYGTYIRTLLIVAQKKG